MRKAKPLIEIRPHTLDEGVNEFDVICRADEFEERELAKLGIAGDVQVHLVTKKSDNEIAVTINTSAAADFTCDRCLAPVQKVLDGSLDLFYSFASYAGEDITDHDEYRHLEKSAEYIDITDEVADTLMLSIPLKVICTDNNPDCQLYRNSQECSETKSGDDIPLVEPVSSWQNSLEELKKKYC